MPILIQALGVPEFDQNIILDARLAIRCNTMIDGDFSRKYCLVLTLVLPERSSLVELHFLMWLHCSDKSLRPQQPSEIRVRARDFMESSPYDVIQRWTMCYRGDDYGRTVSIVMVVDQTYYQALGSNNTQVRHFPHVQCFL